MRFRRWRWWRRRRQNSVPCSADDIPLVAISSSRRSGFQPIRSGTVQRAEAHTSRMVGISRFWLTVSTDPRRSCQAQSSSCRRDRLFDYTSPSSFAPSSVPLAANVFKFPTQPPILSSSASSTTTTSTTIAPSAVAYPPSTMSTPGASSWSSFSSAPPPSAPPLAMPRSRTSCQPGPSQSVAAGQLVHFYRLVLEVRDSVQKQFDLASTADKTQCSLDKTTPVRQLAAAWPTCADRKSSADRPPGARIGIGRLVTKFVPSVHARRRSPISDALYSCAEYTCILVVSITVQNLVWIGAVVSIICKF